ncbi:MAG: mechanosensitive ion channel family protein [Planctomycetaceae bacterium]
MSRSRRRRPSVLVPILVAVAVGGATWGGLSALSGMPAWRSLAADAAAWSARLADLAARASSSAALDEADGMPAAPAAAADAPQAVVSAAGVPALAASAPAAPGPVAPATDPAVESAPAEAAVPAAAVAVAAPESPAAPRAAANEPAALPASPSRPVAAAVEAAAVAASHASAPPAEDAAASTPSFSPLAPLDLSSPRATLASFRGAIDRIAVNMRDGITADERAENFHLIAQVLTALDLSAQAPSLADSKGREAATCLKEVLDRIPLPPEATIPDAAAVKADGIEHWRLPGTEIVLERAQTGRRAGDFIFSADTVARAESFFARVRTLPYRPDAGSPGLHDAYVTVGGNLVPQSLIRRLPAWAHRVILGETVWQWCAAGLLALVFGGVALVTAFLPRLFRSGATRVAAGFLLPAVLAGGSLLTDWLLTYQVRLTGESLVAAKLVLRLALYAGAIAAAMAIMERVTALVVGARARRGDGIDVQLLRLACRVATFVIVAWIGIHAADSLGVPVAPLMAGLGASGLAVALAAQYSIENLIAGVVLFTDRPVRIGDECQYGEIRGRVEQIGLRSTRIRGVDQSLVTIPNAEFAKVQLVNYTRRERIPVRLEVRIRPDAPAALVRELLTRFRDLLGEHARLDPDSPRVRLTGQAADAYTIEVTALALTGDDGEMQTIREEVLLAIMDEIERRHCAAGAEDPPALVLRAA